MALDRLQVRHKQIIDLLIMGMAHKDIAEQVGLSISAVNLIVKSPLVQDELSRRRSGIEQQVDAVMISTAVQAKQRLERAADLAAGVHEDIVLDKEHAYTPEQRQRSADAILNRVLGNDANKQVAQVTILNADKLMMVLQESGLHTGEAPSPNVKPITSHTIESRESGDAKLLALASHGE